MLIFVAASAVIVGGEWPLFFSLVLDPGLHPTSSLRGRVCFDHNLQAFQQWALAVNYNFLQHPSFDGDFAVAAAFGILSKSDLNLIHQPTFTKKKKHHFSNRTTSLRCEISDDHAAVSAPHFRELPIDGDGEEECRTVNTLFEKERISGISPFPPVSRTESHG